MTNNNNRTICGTRGYCDPEVFNNPNNTPVRPYLDCYSFGILLAEFFLDVSPNQFFQNIQTEQQIGNYYSPENVEQVLCKSDRYTCIPLKYRQSFANIVKDCINPSTKDRKSMIDILHVLENYLLKNFLLKINC